MATGSDGSLAGSVELSLLPLKPGDHLWRPLPNGRSWHGLYVGQYVLVPSDEGAALAVPSGEAASSVPHCVVAISAGHVARVFLAAFASGCEALDCSAANEGEKDAINDESVAVAVELDGAESPVRARDGAPRSSRPAQGATVRLYTRRPRGRRESVARALGVVGTRVDEASLGAFPQLLPWWAVFDEALILQPGLCATRARAVRYRLGPRGDAPVRPALMRAVLAGGAVVRQGRVVLRGVRLMKALRLTRAAAGGWSSLGGFVGQAIAASMLDDGDTSTSVATAAGGWAGGIAGGGVAAAALSTLGVEGLGAGSVAGGLVVCSSISAAGAVAGAGLAYAAKKALEGPSAGPDRSAEYHDCMLRLIGDADDVFNLFGATLEFPVEDMADGDDIECLAAAGWYAVRIAPVDFDIDGN